MDVRHLESLRRAEVEMVKDWFRPGMRVLEIGGGYGFQASVMASWGCEVTSIDIGTPSMRPDLQFPVQHYDGKRIPFPNHVFDIVFSSNVLEHVTHLELMLAEISRVVVPGGRVIHILPSSQWRFWTILSHYPFLVKELFSRFWPSADRSPGTATASQTGNGKEGRSILWRVLFARPHGEYPNAIYELYAFSQRRWIRTFRRNGFEIIHCSGNGLFYTGYAVLPRLPIALRRFMASVLGSSARIYAMGVMR